MRGPIPKSLSFLTFTYILTSDKCLFLCVFALFPLNKKLLLTEKVLLLTEKVLLLTEKVLLLTEKVLLLTKKRILLTNKGSLLADKEHLLANKRPMSCSKGPKTDSKGQECAEKRLEIWISAPFFAADGLLIKTGKKDHTSAIVKGYSSEESSSLLRSLVRGAVLYCPSPMVEQGRRSYNEILQAKCMRSVSAARPHCRAAARRKDANRREPWQFAALAWPGERKRAGQPPSRSS